VAGTQVLPPSPVTMPPQTLKPPPPQYSGRVQLPQSTTPPQPSPSKPQFSTWPLPFLPHDVSGVQIVPPSGPRPLLPPHWLKPPPPQYCGGVQAEAPPQLSSPPQPSPA